MELIKRSLEVKRFLFKKKQEEKEKIFNKKLAEREALLKKKMSALDVLKEKQQQTSLDVNKLNNAIEAMQKITKSCEEIESNSIINEDETLIAAEYGNPEAPIIQSFRVHLKSFVIIQKKKIVSLEKSVKDKKESEIIAKKEIEKAEKEVKKILAADIPETSDAADDNIRHAPYPNPWTFKQRHQRKNKEGSYPTNEYMAEDVVFNPLTGAWPSQGHAWKRVANRMPGSMISPNHKQAKA